MNHQSPNLCWLFWGGARADGYVRLMARRKVGGGTEIKPATSIFNAKYLILATTKFNYPKPKNSGRVAQEHIAHFLLISETQCRKILTFFYKRCVTDPATIDSLETTTDIACLRRTRLLKGLLVDSAYLAVDRRNMRAPQISTRKRPMRSGFRSRVSQLYGGICTKLLACSPSRHLGKEAGVALERAAAIQEKHLNEPDDAANTLVEAFKSYRKSDPEDAARVLDQAINHYTIKGNFRRAATYKQNLAELYEVELNDPRKSMDAYETAAGWYESDNAEA